jgi:hypothetical protein
MESLVVECLRCGSHRQAEHSPLRKVDTECPRCGYVGWAPVAALTERERRALRAARATAGAAAAQAGLSVSRRSSDSSA